jgi:hypothetical protein
VDAGRDQVVGDGGGVAAVAAGVMGAGDGEVRVRAVQPGHVDRVERCVGLGQQVGRAGRLGERGETAQAVRGGAVRGGVGQGTFQQRDGFGTRRWDLIAGSIDLLVGVTMLLLLNDIIRTYQYFGVPAYTHLVLYRTEVLSTLALGWVIPCFAVLNGALWLASGFTQPRARTTIR